jgi:hypothetical protein
MPSGEAFSPKPPPLPREHGAWAMLAIPLLLGFAAARRPGVPALSVIPAMLSLYLARSVAVPTAARLARGRPSPPGYVARRAVWAAIYLAGSVAAFAAAAAAADPPARRAALAVGAVVFLLGSAHAALALAGKDRTLVGEALGMAGLAGGASLVTAFAGRPLDGRAAGLALLALSYFFSAAAFVRAFERTKTARTAATVACIAAHAVLLGGLVLLCVTRWIPPLAILSFAPVLARTAWGLRFPPRNVRVLGWREAGVATAFAVIASLALLLSD